MSKARDLRTHPENNINVYDLFSLIVPEKKSKYVETLFRMMKKTSNLEEYAAETRKIMIDKYGMSSEIENASPISVVFFNVLLSGFFESEDLITFKKFCEYNERGIIKQNDLTKYNDLSEIKNAVEVASLIAEKKDLEKQIEIVFESDEWLLLRPLTFLASKKYGANTKWCTTTENNDSYFVKYASNGVLIYCLNKTTGYKVASYFSLLKDEPEFSFWNQKDNRIDSLQTELTHELLMLINQTCKSSNITSNYKLWEKKNSKSIVKTLFGMEKSEKLRSMESPQQPLTPTTPIHENQELRDEIVSIREDNTGSDSEDVETDGEPETLVRREEDGPNLLDRQEYDRVLSEIQLPTVRRTF